MIWSNDPKERPSFAPMADIKDRKFLSLFDIDKDKVNNYINLIQDVPSILKLEESMMEICQNIIFGML